MLYTLMTEVHDSGNSAFDAMPPKPLESVHPKPWQLGKDHPEVFAPMEIKASKLQPGTPPPDRMFAAPAFMTDEASKNEKQKEPTSFPAENSRNQNTTPGNSGSNQPAAIGGIQIKNGVSPVLPVETKAIERAVTEEAADGNTHSAQNIVDRRLNTLEISPIATPKPKRTLRSSPSMEDPTKGSAEQDKTL